MEESKEDAEEEPDRPSSPAPISQASSPKLHWIAQGLVNVLLAATVKKQIRIERKTAQQLFSHLYITSQPGGGVHLLDPILAVLNDLLSAALQSGATESSSSSYNPLALAHLDLSLVNWILLFCCCCLDRTFSSASPSGGNKDSSSSRSVQRWDFMQVNNKRMI